ncbi:T-cell immunoglobulin and mucin domain-containing protein 4 isoform X2 [Paramisgurnus dabryanus]|uniref:T-cell immunoglobulin and mucin domain-containing protein 4 isoform X2 n=1 Tax=Paramisgurnus dabryanus TaxID=90735 RepID=UPI0031F40198
MVVFLFIITSILGGDCSESSKLVVGQVGDAVTLPCIYDIDTHGILDICWGRHQSLFTCENTLISTEGSQVTYRQSRRFGLASGLNQGDVSLTIKGAQLEDDGLYVCRIQIPGLFNDVSHNVYLLIRNIYYASDQTTFVTEKYIRPETTTAEDTEVYVGKAVAVVHKEETIETFVVNTIRLGAIVFIPGLIIALLFRLWRYRKQQQQQGN